MVRSALLVLLLLVSAAHVKADDAADLIAAAQNGDVSAVRRLLDKGVDVNTRSAYQATALSFAAEKGHVEIVRVLLERGADVTVRDTFYHASPLTWAVMRNKPDVATLLIAHGAPEGAEVLPLAVSQGRLDLGRSSSKRRSPGRKHSTAPGRWPPRAARATSPNCSLRLAPNPAPPLRLPFRNRRFSNTPARTRTRKSACRSRSGRSTGG